MLALLTLWYRKIIPPKKRRMLKQSECVAMQTGPAELMKALIRAWGSPTCFSTSPQPAIASLNVGFQLLILFTGTHASQATLPACLLILLPLLLSTLVPNFVFICTHASQATLPASPLPTRWIRWLKLFTDLTGYLDYAAGPKESAFLKSGCFQIVAN